MAELGYVGLGVMGSGIVKRLLDAGHSVTGWNRTKEKAQWLLDAGMGWRELPADRHHLERVLETTHVLLEIFRSVAQLHAALPSSPGAYHDRIELSVACRKAVSLIDFIRVDRC